MVAESGNARIVEVNRAGKIVHEIALTVEKPNPHRDTRMARKLANGNYLVCHEVDGKVREYDPNGKVVWTYALDLAGRPRSPGHGPEGHGTEVFGALRLPNGNTLIACGNGNRVIEVTPKGKIVWELKQDELPGIKLAWVTMLEVKENGNVIVGNCHAGPDNPQLFEVTRDKKVVWRFKNFKTFGNASRGLSSHWHQREGDPVSRAHVALLTVVIGLSILLFLACPSKPNAEPVEPAASTEPPPRGYVCYRAKSAIHIDGRLDDASWNDAPWSEPFRDIEGDKQPEPPLRTRVKMLWDDSALYIAAELEEPHVWATLKKHDSVIFHDNDFEVFIDPDADGHLYGELELNAFGTTWDLLLSKPYKDHGNAINAWEIAGLQAATHVDGTINDPRDTDRGWTLEIAYPWTSLKEISQCPVPPEDGDQWRINFSRVEWDMEIIKGKYHKLPKRPEHNWVWSPQGVINMHCPERWGIVQFSKAVPGTATFHPDPAQPARDYLHRVYYAQIRHKKKFARYADSLAQLGPAAQVDGRVLSHPQLETTTHGFEASVELHLPEGNHERWHITQDAWIGKE